MERVFEWVENTTKWLKITVAGEIDNPQNNILNARKKDFDGLPIEEFREYVNTLSKVLMQSDDGCRKYIFRHLFNMGFTFFLLRKYINPFEIEINPNIVGKFNPNDIKNIEITIFTIITDLDNFYYYVYHTCQEWGYNIEQLLEYCDITGELRPLVYEYFEHRTAQQLQEERGKYKTLARTHRIAAVKMLLDHTGVSNGIDKTKIAAFVEAVTGGNIEAKPQDTISYKKPTKDAKAAAEEWLQEIGINPNKK